MRSRHLPVLLALFLSGCAGLGDYGVPDLSMPAAYKEAKVIREKGWKTATPLDGIPRGTWWSIFRDSALDRLAVQVGTSNQTVKAQEAAWRQAMALVSGAEAGFFPEVGLTGSAIRSGFNSGTTGSGRGGASNTVKDSFALSWEPDFWGRVRMQVASNTASAEASAADIANARLSAEGALAVAYFQMRGVEERRALLDETVAAYRRSSTIVKNQREASIASEADVASAETQLRSAEAEAIATGLTRAQYEHAIAVLTGRAPAELTIPVSGRLVGVPRIPAGIPAELLERRPDIAAAERDVAAAHAAVGVASTAWFPTITLTASGGMTGEHFGDLLKLSHGVWSLGPTLAQTLIDFGAREAQLAEARAQLDQRTALYRQTVLTAFQGVEDQLAALNVLGRQIAAQGEVVTLAKRAVELMLNQYKAGTVAYSNVITAQATALNAEETLISLKTQRLVAAVNLIVALGGGWSTADLPKGPEGRAAASQ
jgi:NodT family efflux transporter outer membrane factor (OMF) lipoprotein